MTVIAENEIKDIVQQVIANISINKEILISSGGNANYDPKPSGKNGIFEKMDDAIKAAQEAFLELNKVTLDRRKKYIQAIRQYALSVTVQVSKIAVEETGMGRAEDKIEKNKLAILKTPGVEDVQTEAFTGDRGMTLQEWAPYGVIGSISPSTNPTETVFNNSIMMISAGNTVVFNPHPAARKCSLLAVETINNAIIASGGPANCVTTVLQPTLESGKILFTHPKIKLLCVTGGPAVVDEAMKSSKKTVAAGPGNPPVVVDETANIDKAAASIITGASLDNNVLCIAEKEIFVVDAVAEKLKSSLKKNNGYELSLSQLDKLMTKIISKMPEKEGEEAVVNRNFVGRNANVIARELGLNLPDTTRLLFADVPNDHPLIYIEQLMPVMPLSRVKNFDRALELAYKAEHNYFHTAMMHSMNVDRLTQMGKLMNVSIFVKNGPSCAGLGFGGEGYTTFTIASPTGDGLTRPRTFTRMRRCSMIDYLRII
ncbi:aldehyde dehydrogenase EutE [Candidatus Dependentiae bacterium]|nr:aldehyde dehydrogenase EutE [Candidatus Dependentiae bacterium]